MQTPPLVASVKVCMGLQKPDKLILTAGSFCNLVSDKAIISNLLFNEASNTLNSSI